MKRISFLPRVASRPAALAVGAFALVGCAGAVADVLLGNLPGDDLSNYDVSGVLPSTAVSFTTPGVDQQLSDVQLRLALYDNGNALVQIAADNGNEPGASIATLNPPGGSGAGAQTWTFTPGGAVVLSAGTTYWLVVDNAPDQGLFWVGNGGTPTGLGTFGSYRETADGINWTDYVTGTPAFEINTVPVPEPAAATATALGLVLATGFVQRRRAR